MSIYNFSLKKLTIWKKKSYKIINIIICFKYFTFFVSSRVDFTLLSPGLECSYHAELDMKSDALERIRPVEAI